MNAGTFCLSSHLTSRCDFEDHQPGQTLEQSAEENELVEGARRKDPVAIRLLIKQQNQRLYRIARSIVRDDSDAEDVLQEAYVRAFAGLEGFRGEARIGTWLARIVINEALGWRRRRRPTTEISLASTDTGPNAQIIPFPGANRIAILRRQWPDPKSTRCSSALSMDSRRGSGKCLSPGWSKG